MRFAIVICLFAVPVLAQTGILSGTVTDPDGKGVAAAPVQAKNVMTGMVYKTVAAAGGRFRLGKLPAGSYDITVPPIGFTFPKYEQKGVVIQGAQTAKLDIRLVWGGNLGTPGDDFSLIARARSAAPKGPAPRGRDGKPDFSAVWIGNAPDVDAPDLLPWADEITKQRRARGTQEIPRNLACRATNSWYRLSFTKSFRRLR